MKQGKAMFKLIKLQVQKGFTLMEMAITIAVTGILMAVAVPYFVDLSSKAATSALQSNVSALQSAYAVAAASAGGNPVISAVIAELNMQNATIAYAPASGFTITLTGRTSNAVITTTTSTTAGCASPTANGGTTASYLCSLGTITITP